MTANLSRLEKLMPRCKTKDTHDFPGLKPGERCPNCEIWEAVDREVEVAELWGQIKALKSVSTRLMSVGENELERLNNKELKDLARHLAELEGEDSHASA